MNATDQKIRDLVIDCTACDSSNFLKDITAYEYVAAAGFRGVLMWYTECPKCKLRTVINYEGAAERAISRSINQNIQQVEALRAQGRRSGGNRKAMRAREKKIKSIGAIIAGQQKKVRRVRDTLAAQLQPLTSLAIGDTYHHEKDTAGAA